MSPKVEPAEAAEAALVWLRSRARWSNVATPVDELARRMGLDIATFDAALHPNVWGYLEPGENLIFLRKGLSTPVRRFTLAHEIGHVVLHRRGGGAALLWGDDASDGAHSFEACSGADLDPIEEPGDEALQPGQVYNARSVVEREANAFAVALLMPGDLFQATYLAMKAQTGQDASVGRVTRALARKFGVSEDAALRRLQSLLAPGRAADTPTHTPRLGDDDDQRLAARAETPALVMAGPGTGKTSTLVGRLTHLTLERGVAPENILALTFSHKAADEIRARAVAALVGSGVDREPYVSTIHHFCLDALGLYGDQIGLPSDVRLAREIELYFLVRDVMRETPLERLATPFAPDFRVRDVLQLIARAKDDLVSPNAALALAERMSESASDEAQRDAAERQLEFAVVYAAYQLRLRDQRALDFGDVIGFVAALLTDRPDIARDIVARWPHLLVDEYQDINHAMDVLLRELVAAGARLWAVGDSDQAIYRFRGADPGIVRRFRETFPSATVFVLQRNYRSHQTILDAASGFAATFSGDTTRVPLAAARTVERVERDRSVVMLASAKTDTEELTGIAEAIEARRASGRPYGEQVALLRTRKQVEQVVSGLGVRGVPTTTTTTALETPAMKRLLAVVSLLSESSGAGLIRAGRQPEHIVDRADAVTLIRESRARRTPVRDLLTRPRSLTGVSQSGQTALMRLGRWLHQMRKAQNVATGLNLYCFAFTDLGARALTDGEGSGAAALRRVLDLARAFDSWRAVVTPRLGADGASSGADWRGFAEYLRAAATFRLDVLTLPDAADTGENGAVRVMTVHSSKGLEFPVVYLPQLANRRFPLTGRGPLVGVAEASIEDEARGGGDLSEEASLFYVALTRARDELVLSYARRYGKASYTASPFLPAIEEALGADLTKMEWHDEASTAADEDVVGAARDTAADSPDTPYEIAELELYQRCPRQYAYRYVDRLWSPPTLAAIYNSTTRTASRRLAALFTSRLAEDTPAPTRDEALALARECWREALSQEWRSESDTPPAQEDALVAFYARQTQSFIERMWARLTYDGGSPGADEGVTETGRTPVTVRVGAVLVHGEVDVRESGDGLTVVAGGKSGQSSKGLGMRELFVATAAEDVRERSRASGAASRQSSPIAISDRQRARLVGQVEAAASGIAQRDFHPAPEERMCQRCPFAASCPD